MLGYPLFNKTQYYRQRDFILPLPNHSIPRDSDTLPNRTRPPEIPTTLVS
jgi:hypothetical protein